MDKIDNYHFIYRCYVRIYKNWFCDLIDEQEERYKIFTIDKTNDDFKKQYDYLWETENEKNPNACVGEIQYKYLDSYLRLYLENIYGYIKDRKVDASCIINNSYIYHPINPFQYVENVIAFKKSKTIHKDFIIKNIYKLGFILDESFYGVREIKTGKD